MIIQLFHLQDLNSNSPYCLPYNYYDSFSNFGHSLPCCLQYYFFAIGVFLHLNLLCMLLYVQ